MSKKLFASKAVKSDERQRFRQEMKDSSKGAYKTHKKAHIYSIGSQVEQKSSHRAQQWSIVSHRKHNLQKSE